MLDNSSQSLCPFVDDRAMVIGGVVGVVLVQVGDDVPLGVRLLKVGGVTALRPRGRNALAMMMTMVMSHQCIPTLWVRSFEIKLNGRSKWYRGA